MRKSMGPKTAAGRAACAAAGRIGAAKSTAARRAKAKPARTIRVWDGDYMEARRAVGDIRPDAALFHAVMGLIGSGRT